jgi:hypothetical protein
MTFLGMDQTGMLGREERAESEVVAIVEGGSDMFDVAPTAPHRSNVERPR